MHVKRIVGVVAVVAALCAPAAAQTVFVSETPIVALTPTTATGTTVNDVGVPGVRAYKVTVDRAAFVCAAVTCDVTLATIPAKTKITGVVADLTVAFACTGTCTSSTLSFTVGKTAGGNEYLLSADADAAAARFGLTAATTGASLVANASQAGDVPNWTGTTTLSVRMTSGTGNIGSGAATNFSTGSVTFYVMFSTFP